MKDVNFYTILGITRNLQRRMDRYDRVLSYLHLGLAEGGFKLSRKDRKALNLRIKRDARSDDPRVVVQVDAHTVRYVPRSQLKPTDKVVG